MIKSIPFTVCLKASPDYTSNRKDSIRRTREILAYKVYQKISIGSEVPTSPALLVTNLARPGGSSVYTIENVHGFGTIVGAMNIKPEGIEPDLLSITGFFQSTHDRSEINTITYINANESISGPICGAPGWTANLEPNQNLNVKVREVIIDILSLLDDLPLDIYWIETCGVKYGVGGYTLP